MPDPESSPCRQPLLVIFGDGLCCSPPAPRFHDNDWHRMGPAGWQHLPAPCRRSPPRFGVSITHGRDAGASKGALCRPTTQISWLFCKCLCSTFQATGKRQGAQQDGARQTNTCSWLGEEKVNGAGKKQNAPGPAHGAAFGAARCAQAALRPLSHRAGR